MPSWGCIEAEAAGHIGLAGRIGVEAAGIGEAEHIAGEGIVARRTLA